MRRIILSLLICLALTAAVAGSTAAYFNDTSTISGMSFATGTLKLSNNSASWTTHVSFPNLKPGDMVRKWVTLGNSGTLDIASLRVSAINQTNPNLLGVLRVTVYGQVEGSDQGIYTPDWGNGQPVSTWLNNVDILGTAVYRDATAAHVLAPGKNDTIILDFKVPTTVDNNYQGQSASFDLQFFAEQSHTGSSYF
ncbi:CalY family protein [Patescibacteria group bacterium]|nr:CalY family protein [Patescibacteria group bacterium]